MVDWLKGRNFWQFLFRSAKSIAWIVIANGFGIFVLIYNIYIDPIEEVYWRYFVIGFLIFFLFMVWIRDVLLYKKVKKYSTK